MLDENINADLLAEKQQKRVVGRPFPRGVSGNPSGRPVGTKNLTTKVREALEKIAEGEDYTYEEAFIKSILKKAILDGDTSTQRLIWNYLDGMPTQKIEQSNELKVYCWGEYQD